MNLFLSYATENSDIAEEIYFALVGDGHDVFFDRPLLKPGETYGQRLRDAIETADGVIFLISPQSVQSGSYALTELKYARQKWVHPERRVLPVMIKPTCLDAIPAYLRAVTILQPEGNIAAEVHEALKCWDNPTSRATRRHGILHDAGHLWSYPLTFIQDLIDLVSGPKRFVAQHRDKGTLTIGRALGFLAFSELISWSVPPYELGIIASDLSFILMEITVYLLALALAWRIVGGRATLLDYLPIHPYYIAIFNLLTLALNRIWSSVLRLTDEPSYAVAMEIRRSGDVLRWQEVHINLPFSIAVLLGVVILICWFVASWGAYRVLNGTSRQRSAVAGLIFFGLAILSSGVLFLVASELLAEVWSFLRRATYSLKG